MSLNARILWAFKSSFFGCILTYSNFLPIVQAQYWFNGDVLPKVETIESPKLELLNTEVKPAQKNSLDFSKLSYTESEYENAGKYVKLNWMPDSNIIKDAYIDAGGTHMEYWDNLVDENNNKVEKSVDTDSSKKLQVTSDNN